MVNAKLSSAWKKIKQITALGTRGAGPRAPHALPARRAACGTGCSVTAGGTGGYGLVVGEISFSAFTTTLAPPTLKVIAFCFVVSTSAMIFCRNAGVVGTTWPVAGSKE